MHPSDSLSDVASQETVPPLCEDVQLVLSLGGGKLQVGGMDLAAAALVELVIRGRVGSVPERGFMARKDVRKLTVISEEPVGVTALDAALKAVVAKGKPWNAYSSLRKIWRPVASATQDALIARGAIARSGPFGGLKSALSIVDERQYRAAVARLDAAWLRPESVTDVRSAAFVDLLRNSPPSFNRGAQLPHGTQNAPLIEREWYPSEIRDTLVGIFQAQRAATGVGTGYEG